jgi:hypothetical protein
VSASSGDEVKNNGCKTLPPGKQTGKLSKYTMFFDHILLQYLPNQDRYDNPYMHSGKGSLSVLGMKEY